MKTLAPARGRLYTLLFTGAAIAVALAARSARAGAAARRLAILHRDPGRHRPRRLVEAERWPEGEIPTLHVRRHGQGPIPAPDRVSRRGPPAARDRNLDGRHAHMAVGRDVPRLHGRPPAARVPAERDRGPEPHVAKDGDGSHPRGPRLEGRRIRRAAAGSKGGARAHAPSLGKPAPVDAAGARPGGRRRGGRNLYEGPFLELSLIHISEPTRPY